VVSIRLSLMVSALERLRASERPSVQLGHLRYNVHS
jgi:hypothetical protein